MLTLNPLVSRICPRLCATIYVSYYLPPKRSNIVSMRMRICSITQRRITVEDALAHPYFDSLRSDDDVDQRKCATFDFVNVSMPLQREHLRDLLQAQVDAFRSRRDSAT